MMTPLTPHYTDMYIQIAIAAFVILYARRMYLSTQLVAGQSDRNWYLITGVLEIGFLSIIWPLTLFFVLGEFFVKSFSNNL